MTNSPAYLARVACPYLLRRLASQSRCSRDFALADRNSDSIQSLDAPQVIPAGSMRSGSGGVIADAITYRD